MRAAIASALSGAFATIELAAYVSRSSVPSGVCPARWHCDTVRPKQPVAARDRAIGGDDARGDDVVAEETPGPRHHSDASTECEARHTDGRAASARHAGVHRAEGPVQVDELHARPDDRVISPHVDRVQRCGVDDKAHPGGPAAVAVAAAAEREWNVICRRESDARPDVID